MSLSDKKDNTLGRGRTLEGGGCRPARVRDSYLSWPLLSSVRLLGWVADMPWASLLCCRWLQAAVTRPQEGRHASEKPGTARSGWLVCPLGSRPYFSQCLAWELQRLGGLGPLLKWGARSWLSPSRGEDEGSCCCCPGGSGSPSTT